MDGLALKEYRLVTFFPFSVHFFSSVSGTCRGEQYHATVNGHDEWFG